MSYNIESTVRKLTTENDDINIVSTSVRKQSLAEQREAMKSVMTDICKQMFALDDKKDICIGITNDMVRRAPESLSAGIYYYFNDAIEKAYKGKLTRSALSIVRDYTITDEIIVELIDLNDMAREIYSITPEGVTRDSMTIIDQVLADEYSHCLRQLISVMHQMRMMAKQSSFEIPEVMDEYIESAGAALYSLLKRAMHGDMNTEDIHVCLKHGGMVINSIINVDDFDDSDFIELVVRIDGINAFSTWLKHAQCIRR